MVISILEDASSLVRVFLLWVHAEVPGECQQQQLRQREDQLQSTALPEFTNVSTLGLPWLQNEGKSQQQQSEREKEQLRADAEGAWQEVGRLERQVSRLESEATQTSLKAAQDMQTLTHNHTISQVWCCTTTVMIAHFHGCCSRARDICIFKATWDLQALMHNDTSSHTISLPKPNHDLQTKLAIKIYGQYCSYCSHGEDKHW